MPQMTWQEEIEPSENYGRGQKYLVQVFTQSSTSIQVTQQNANNNAQGGLNDDHKNHVEIRNIFIPAQYNPQSSNPLLPKFLEENLVKSQGK